jgi:DNA-binding response OmpR family regulator/anti-sigma regulatory factor (Ser/Thr protein kinase)
MKSWRILAVDDEPINLDIIVDILDAPEFRVHTVANAEAAWAMIEGSSYDVVILDRMMPGLDGLTLLRRIKSDPHYLNLPVIMQTAASAPEQVREGIEAGAYYYLTKPYDPRALLAIVRAALSIAEAHSRIGVDAKEHGQALALARRGEFSFRTLDQAAVLAGFLATLCPQPSIARMGLAELLINAVEHGNLDIGYGEKSRLQLNNALDAEIIRRLSDSQWRERAAEVSFERDAHKIAFIIADQGEGFNYLDYLDLDPCRASDPNGRGIALARRMSFSDIEYRGCGNVVVASIEL